jgi:hypothetical protein
MSFTSRTFKIIVLIAVAAASSIAYAGRYCVEERCSTCTATDDEGNTFKYDCNCKCIAWDTTEE